MRAATAIEYAMVAAGISVVVVSAVNLLGQNVNEMFFARIAAAI
ncbi:MAG: Flp family type IVb pilin [Rhizomicrobium sp.]